MPEARSTTSWGTPALDLGAGVRAQLEAAGITDVRVVDACTREDPTLAVLPPRRRRRDPVRRRHLEPPVTERPPTPPPRRAGRQPRRRTTSHRRGVPRQPGATRPRSRSSSSPSSSPPPTCGCWPTSASPTSGRTATRRPRPRPPSAPTSALRWHFIGGLQSNKAGAVAHYADVVESVDRAKLVGPLSRGAHSRGHDVDVLLQVSLDPPGADNRSGADAADLAELARRVEEAGMLRLRGLMAVAPLGEDPDDRLRAARRDPPGLPRRAPRRHRAVRGDERRPRGGHHPRRDTRACRLRGPRSEACGPVMSTTVIQAPGPGRQV